MSDNLRGRRGLKQQEEGHGQAMVHYTQRNSGGKPTFLTLSFSSLNDI
jgi:hypothetical protein